MFVACGMLKLDLQTNSEKIMRAVVYRRSAEISPPTLTLKRTTINHSSSHLLPSFRVGANISDYEAFHAAAPTVINGCWFSDTPAPPSCFNCRSLTLAVSGCFTPWGIWGIPHTGLCTSQVLQSSGFSQIIQSQRFGPCELAFRRSELWNDWSRSTESVPDICAPGPIKHLKN